jgi:hypothetical protein
VEQPLRGDPAVLPLALEDIVAAKKMIVMMTMTTTMMTAKMEDPSKDAVVGEQARKEY